MKLAMAVLIFFSTREVGVGQSAHEQVDWASKGRAFNRTGQYSAAAGAFQKALAVDEANGIEDDRTIWMHESLAVAYTESGQLADARREYQNALALADKIGSRDILLRGLLVARMAAISDENSNDTTVTELRQAIAATRETASADQLAVMCVSLAHILSSRKEYDEAETLLREAIANLRKEKNPAPRRLLDSLNALGVLLFNQQRYCESNRDAIVAVRTFESPVEISGCSMASER